MNDSVKQSYRIVYNILTNRFWTDEKTLRGIGKSRTFAARKGNERDKVAKYERTKKSEIKTILPI